MAGAMTPETKQVLAVLRTAMGVLGYKNRQIEVKLGVSAGYLSRVFSGGIELRHDLIVEIARAMELEPGEIFRAAYPAMTAEPPSPAAAKIRSALERFAGAVPPPPTEGLQPSSPAALPSSSPEEMERLIGKVLRQFFRELASPDQRTG